MKKFKVSVPVDYVQGHLRNGHKELEIEVESLDKAQEYMNSDEGIDEFKDCAEIIIDSYEVDDCGNCNFEEMEIEEVAE